MNIEGVKNDSKATSLKALPPPELASGQKLDASTAVLDYNEILQSMEDPGQQQQQQPEEYYEDDLDDDRIIEGDDDVIYEEPPPPRRRTTAGVVRHRRAPSALRRVKMPSCEPPPPPPSLLWRYRRAILVAAVAAVALYVLTARLPGWLPRSVGPSGGFSVIGMAIVTLAIAGGFFVGDEYVLATWKGHS